jgi:hypothetical protein
VKVAAAIVLVTLAVTGPAFAQVDLSGAWRPMLHEDLGHRLDEAGGAPGICCAGGPWIGDYTGLPINAAARLKAESWDARVESAPERQTILQPGVYWALSPGGIRILPIVDEASQRPVALTFFRAGLAGATSRVIWMDGRPHPPTHAAHTWQGFSTGTWRGHVLTVTTTHLKAGFIRRNGVPSSDTAIVTEQFMRHGSYLTLARIVHDPIYLDEPHLTSVTWQIDPGLQLPPSPSGTIANEVPGAAKAYVPHHLPGTNGGLREFANTFRLPYEATRGGKDTTYPEYQRTLKALMAARGPS